MRRILCVLVFLCSTLNSQEADWKRALREKINNNERPEWMIKQIHSDLEPFVEKGINNELIKTVHSPKLFRIEIRDNKLIFHDRKSPTKKKGGVPQNLLTLYETLLTIQEIATLPNLEFSLSCHDSFYHDQSLKNTKGPLFSFAKRTFDDGVILFPDFDNLKGHFSSLKEVEIGNRAYPWVQKEEKAFWRGINSGFINYKHEFMNKDTYRLFPRVQLVEVSKEIPDLLDARFHKLRTNTFTSVKQSLEDLGFVGSSCSIPEHLKYKYLLLVDGYTCAFARAYWQLFSNSVIIKQDSDEVQWYYGALEPYVHYIPVASDFSDLYEKIVWAKSNDREAQQIAQNAMDFAHTHLRYEDTLLYVYLLLTEYSKLMR